MLQNGFAFLCFQLNTKEETLPANIEAGIPGFGGGISIFLAQDCDLARLCYDYIRSTENKIDPDI